MNLSLFLIDYILNNSFPYVDSFACGFTTNTKEYHEMKVWMNYCYDMAAGIDTAGIYKFNIGGALGVWPMNSEFIGDEQRLKEMIITFSFDHYISETYMEFKRIKVNTIQQRINLHGRSVPKSDSPIYKFSFNTVEDAVRHKFEYRDSW